MNGSEAWMQLGQIGYQNTKGEITMYAPGGLTLRGNTSLEGNKITNLANGTVSNDAVNYSQLMAVKALIPTDPATDANAVHYDDGTLKDKVTLGGGTAGTTITNVKAGDITQATSTDAVNGGQLFTTNQNVTNLTNNFNTLNTTVDGLLDDALLWDDGATAYSAKHDGASAKITDVLAGTVSSTSTDAINGAQLHGTAQSAADALGGGSAVGADGKISKPTYSVDDKPAEGVQAAIDALDARFDNIGPGADSLNWDGTAYNAQRDATDQRITGVASAVNANDAVNKADLDALVGPIAPKLKYIKFGSTTAADAIATGDNSLAIGGFAQASGVDALAIGANARATGTNSVAVGAGSATKEADTFAVGSTATQRRIVNVKAGELSTDAATVGQLEDKFAAAIARINGTSQPMLKTSGMLQPMAVSSLTPDKLIVSGPNGNLTTPTDAIGDYSIAIGLNAHASAEYAVAVGNNASTQGVESVAVGQNVGITQGNYSTILGVDSTIASANATLVGTLSEINTDSEKAVVIGYNNAVGGQGTVAIGSDILANGKNSVVLGASSSDDGRSNVISVGSAGTLAGTSKINRQIINVLAGTLETDAVNFGQLKATALSVATALGGTEGGVNTDGTVKVPKYKINGVDKSGVGEAIAALDARTTTVTNDALLWDATANGGTGAYSAKHGTQATSKIVNVATGTADNDAVNVKQLNDKFATLPTNPNAVSYDDLNKSAITMGGTKFDPLNNTGGTKLTNVAVATADSDAVNLKQLKDAGLFDPNGEPLNAVVYDSDAKSAVTFGGSAFNSKDNTGGTTLTNVAVAKADSDAVNLKQLKDAGLFDPNGEPLNAVVYDSDAKGAITLGGTAFDSSTGTGGTKVTNVATASADSDAINLKQLNDTVAGYTELGEKIKYIKFGYTTALEANATGDNAIAIGGFAQASGKGALAIGANARASGENAVALGAGSATKEADTFAVGSSSKQRRIVNVAYGSALTDAATVGQVDDKIDAALAEIAPTMLKASSMLQPTASSLPPDKLVVAGPNGDQTTPTEALGEKAIAIGLNAHASAEEAVAIGQNSSTQGVKSVAVGQNVGITQGDGSTIVGVDSTVASANAVVIGKESEVNTESDGAVAIGYYNSVGGEGTLAIGSKIIANGKNSVVLGASSSDDGRDNVISVGSAGTLAGTSKINRQIINVMAGTLDSDAVNVSQLKSAAAAIGGGSVVGADGKVTLPTYKIGGADTTGTLAEGISALDRRINEGPTPNPLAVAYDSAAKDTLTLGGLNVDGKPATAPVKLTNVAAATENTDAVNLGQLKDAGLFDPEGEPLDAVVYDKDSEKAKVTFGGTEGTVLDNVAAGVVSATSKQAVNGSQLFGTAKSLADALGGTATVGADGRVSMPEYSVGGEKVSGVGGAVSALDDRINGMTGSVTDALRWDAAAAGGPAYSAAHGTQAISRITNVAEATQATDAVNKGQFDRAINDLSTKADPMSVKYDGTDKTKVTLGGLRDGVAATAPVKLTNLAAGTGDTDAVNVKQLKDAGLIGGPGNEVLNAVVYDANSQRASVTFGGVNGTTLNNVADGMINRDSRQAVNGGQIFQLKEQLNQQITNIDARVTNIEVNGGGGKVPYIAAVGHEDEVPVSTGAAARAAVRTPAPANAGNTPGIAVGYDSVATGDDASAVGDHATAYAKDSLAVGNHASVAEGGANSVALGNGSVASAANTVSIGRAGAERTITNVARGSADTDAVNVGQMRESLSEAKAYTDTQLNDVWNGLGQELDEVNRQANRGIAAASALINVTPYAPGHVTVNAGLANYRGETALGVGVSRWSDNGRLNLNAGVSAAKDDDPVIRVGIGYIF